MCASLTHSQSIQTLVPTLTHNLASSFSSQSAPEVHQIDEFNLKKVQSLRKSSGKQGFLHNNRTGACKLDLLTSELLWIDEGSMVLTLIPGLLFTIGPHNLSVRYQSILLLELPTF